MSARVKGKMESTTEKKLITKEKVTSSSTSSSTKKSEKSDTKNKQVEGGGIEYEESDESALLSSLKPDDEFICSLQKLCLHGNAKLKDAGTYIF
jgi:hypothetical protein